MFIEKYCRFNALLHFMYYKYVKSIRYVKRKKIKYDPYFNLEELLNRINIPKNKILFLHVGLRDIKAITNKSYEELTNDIVRFFKFKFSPFALVVPTFTWSFRVTGVYSIMYSKSETGVFSELFRKIADYRTPNAIQSFSIISNYIDTFKGLNHNDTFANDGIYEFLRKNETFIIDISTDTYRASPLHHIERVCNLCYLKAPAKKFEGYLYDEKNNVKKIVQMHGGTNIYDGPFIFNKQKIEKFIKKKKILKVYHYNRIKVSITSNQALHRVLENKLEENPFFAITF